MKFFQRSWLFILTGFIILAVIVITFLPHSSRQKDLPSRRDTTYPVVEWKAPDILSLPQTEDANLIRYGRELIANTAKYLGPHGSVAAISNGMNCQNCHLDAGRRPYSNCLSAVSATYPEFRPKSGRVESIESRINDCLERSLNGKPIDSLSAEMRAIVAFLKWIGKDVPKGVKPKGAGTEELPFMERAADPVKGKALYLTKCPVCHGENGTGVKQPDSAAFIYPPLWGANSYNVGAGLYQLTKFAGYIKNSMPFGASHQSPQLSNEECWDIAAFVNSQPRPNKTFPDDWPVLVLKSIDFPFGPYADSFSENQHKFGPFGPIKNVEK